MSDDGKCFRCGAALTLTLVVRNDTGQELEVLPVATVHDNAMRVELQIVPKTAATRLAAAALGMNHQGKGPSS